MFRLIRKIGFQRFVAVLLLATFAPLAILSEACHLIPGLGEKCGCFKVVNTNNADSLPNSNKCSHNHSLFSSSGDVDGIGAKFIEVDSAYNLSMFSVEHYDECVLHAFCSMFNSGVIAFVELVSSGFILLFVGIDDISFVNDFCSLNMARAPPLY
ncbi:MAG: hypothetical protein LBP59_08650 [Planctomycetaceae bacterium]|jgi:hypothetical protein|nr:hypothetical protein [Planctomycetaceae bacterium]